MSVALVSFNCLHTPINSPILCSSAIYLLLIVLGLAGAQLWTNVFCAAAVALWLLVHWYATHFLCTMRTWRITQNVRCGHHCARAAACTHVLRLGENRPGETPGPLRTNHERKGGYSRGHCGEGGGRKSLSRTIHFPKALRSVASIAAVAACPERLLSS